MQQAAAREPCLFEPIMPLVDTTSESDDLSEEKNRSIASDTKALAVRDKSLIKDADESSFHSE